MLRWEDEKYVKLYTRDTLDWSALSFEAQGLMGLLMRKVDRAGLLVLGRHGKRGVAAAVGHAHRWDTIEKALEELIADTCVEIRENVLIIRNFLTAQEAQATQTARKAAQRERDRDKARAAGMGHLSPSAQDEMAQLGRLDGPVTPEVTPDGHTEVTPDGHTEVTPDGHTEVTPSVPTQTNQTNQTTSVAGATAVAPAGGGGHPPDDVPEFQLEPEADPPAKKPPKLSDHERLREVLFDLRMKHGRGDDHGFLASRKECNAAMANTLAWIGERNGCDPPGSRTLLLQAAELYLRDDWPGKMTQLSPWDFRALFKRERLGDYVAKAKAMQWQQRSEDNWEPA